MDQMSNHFTIAERLFIVSQIDGVLDQFQSFSGHRRPSVNAKILKNVFRLTIQQFNQITRKNVRKTLKQGMPGAGIHYISTDKCNFTHAWTELTRTGWLLHDGPVTYLNLLSMFKLARALMEPQMTPDLAEKFDRINEKIAVYWSRHNLQISAIHGGKDFMTKYLQRFETDHPVGRETAVKSLKTKTKIMNERKFKPAERLTHDDIRREFAARFEDFGLTFGPWTPEKRLNGNARTFVKECCSLGLDPRTVIVVTAENWHSIRKCIRNAVGQPVQAPEAIIGFGFFFTYRRDILEYLTVNNKLGERKVIPLVEKKEKMFIFS